jgi:hypothetical protein
MNKQAQRVIGRAAPGGFSRDAAVGSAPTLPLVGKQVADLPSGAREKGGPDGGCALSMKKSVIIGYEWSVDEGRMSSRAR